MAVADRGVSYVIIIIWIVEFTTMFPCRHTLQYVKN